MSLSVISILIGLVALSFTFLAIVREGTIKQCIINFPRNKKAGQVLTAIVCVLAAREAYMMNMGGLTPYKAAIFFIAPLVYLGSVIYIKELLAARALGGLLCLVSVPIVRIAALSEAPYFQIISFIAYIWVISGITFLLAPWQFRKMHAALFNKKYNYKLALCLKASVGIFLIILGILVY